MAEFLQDGGRGRLRNKGMYRPDGSRKGLGYFGAVKRPDGMVSTELSIGVPIRGRESLIPTMVPSLTNQEIDYLVSGKYNPGNRQGIDRVISEKAIQFAEERAAKGLPFFARPDEEGKFRPAPAPVPAPIEAKTPAVPLAPIPQGVPSAVPTSPYAIPQGSIQNQRLLQMMRALKK